MSHFDCLDDNFVEKFSKFGKDHLYIFITDKRPLKQKYSGVINGTPMCIPTFCLFLRVFATSSFSNDKHSLQNVHHDKHNTLNTNSRNVVDKYMAIQIMNEVEENVKNLYLSNILTLEFPVDDLSYLKATKHFNEKHPDVIPDSVKFVCVAGFEDIVARYAFLTALSMLDLYSELAYVLEKICIDSCNLSQLVLNEIEASKALQQPINQTKILFRIEQFHEYMLVRLVYAVYIEALVKPKKMVFFVHWPYLIQQEVKNHIANHVYKAERSIFYDIIHAYINPTYFAKNNVWVLLKRNSCVLNGLIDAVYKEFSRNYESLIDSSIYLYEVIFSLAPGTSLNYLKAKFEAGKDYDAIVANFLQKIYSVKKEKVSNRRFGTILLSKSDISYIKEKYLRPNILKGVRLNKSTKKISIQFDSFLRYIGLTFSDQKLFCPITSELMPDPVKFNDSDFKASLAGHLIVALSCITPEKSKIINYSEFYKKFYNTLHCKTLSIVKQKEWLMFDEIYRRCGMFGRHMKEFARYTQLGNEESTVCKVFDYVTSHYFDDNEINDLILWSIENRYSLGTKSSLENIRENSGVLKRKAQQSDDTGNTSMKIAKRDFCT